MVQWTTKQDDSGYGWFQGKVCVCDKANIYHNGFDWDTMAEFKQPPICATCHCWANRIMSCTRCGEMYYQFFSHPRMGYHTAPRKGWYCWNCLEKYAPPVVEKNAGLRDKIPPPAMVLPPGYTLYVEERFF